MNARKVGQVVVIALVLFSMLGCGIIQCGAAVNGNVNQNVSVDNDSFGWIVFAAIVICFMIFVMAICSRGGMG